MAGDRPNSAKPGNDVDDIDRTYYTWSTLFKGIIGTAKKEEVQAYNRAYDLVNAERQVRRCERTRDWLFNNSPMVRFMRDECAKLGADIGPHNVHCRNCVTAQRAGFAKRYGILLCANETMKKGRLEESLVHEMVHAYDNLRWKFDDLNEKHVACTEIRAATLSSQCRFTRHYVAKGNYTFLRGFQDCVRETAELSMCERPGIKSKEHAREVVNSVWTSCFNDTRPFDEIYK